MKRVAVYPGSFDPITSGHLDLMDRGRRHFDELVVAILINDLKQPFFTVEERLDLIRDAIKGWDNVRVDSFDGLLVDYADQVGARMILRGVRAVTDFEYEMQMAMMNRRLHPDLETVFLMPSETYSYVSSRLVREIGKLGGELEGLTPPLVQAALRRKVGLE